MKKIYLFSDISSLIDSIRKKKTKINVVGGCFDVLHIGHIRFLREAKNISNELLLLLESDEKVNKIKGTGRPIFNQNERAEMLASLKSVDYIILLPYLKKDTQYLEIIQKIKPDQITVTSGDVNYHKKKLQADKVGAKISIIPKIKTFSSSKLARIIGVD